MIKKISERPEAHPYLIIGGMPAVVAGFVETNDLRSVRQIQKNILSLYRWDISKYQKESSLLIKNMYDIIPAELNQQNKRFILKNMNEGARFNRCADSLVWLSDAGVALPVYCVEEPVYPLMLSSSTNLFKLFLSDVGLLTSTFLKSTAFNILVKNPNINYGSIYENAVAQELNTAGFDVYYYKIKSEGSWILFSRTGKGILFLLKLNQGKTIKGIMPCLIFWKFQNIILKRDLFYVMRISVKMAKSLICQSIWLDFLLQWSNRIS